MSLKVYYDETDFRLKGWRRISGKLNEVIREYGYSPGDLSFVFTNDDNLLAINKEFLNHDYLTDVITFDNRVDNILNGEIYISVERVKDNAVNYKVSFGQEILRVMIHGILHLAGYSDKEAGQKRKMRKAEEEWLLKAGEK